MLLLILILHQATDNDVPRSLCRRPLCCVLGGAKVADKIGVVSALIEVADVVLVGGRMAFTLLASQGVMVGSTQVEEEWLEVSAAGGQLRAV